MRALPIILLLLIAKFVNASDFRDLEPIVGNPTLAALAEEVRIRDLSNSELASLGRDQYSQSAYLIAAFGEVRKGRVPAPIPFGSERGPLNGAMNRLLGSLRAGVATDRRWLESFFYEFDMAAYCAWLIAFDGAEDPTITSLFVKKYGRFDPGTSPKVWQYYKLIASEPADLPQKVRFLLTRPSEMSELVIVRLVDLGPEARTEVVAVLNAQQPASSEPQRDIVAWRGAFVLFVSGDARVSSVDLSQMSRVSTGFMETFASVRQVPQGTIDQHWTRAHKFGEWTNRRASFEIRSRRMKR